MERRRKWMHRLLALALGAVVSAGLAEVVLRLYNPFDLRLRGTRIVLPTNRTLVFNVVDPAAKLDPEIKVTSNSLGFRGKEPPADFDNWLTIVAVGGSTTECHYLSDDRTWPARLEKLLVDRLQKVWVNNAGLDGQSTFGHHLLFEQVLSNLRPDYLLLLVGLNDVGREDLNDFDAAARVESQRWHDRLIAASELLSTAQALYRTYRAFHLGVVHEWTLDLHAAPIGQFDPAKTAAMLAEHSARYVPKFAARLRTLIEASRGAGIEPILITQPVLFGDLTDPSTGVRIRDQLHGDIAACDHWSILELYNDATRALGRAAKIHVIDLARALPKDSALYYDWLHYTNAGAERVAEIVAQNLTQFLAGRGEIESGAR